jgi:hypothetical protein
MGSAFTILPLLGESSSSSSMRVFVNLASTAVFFSVVVMEILYLLKTSQHVIDAVVRRFLHGVRWAVR